MASRLFEITYLSIMKPIFLWPRLPLHQRDQLPKASGLYAVVSMGRLLYVGRSTNLNRRWTAREDREHHRLPQAQDLLFPYLHYIEVPERRIAAAEKRLIARVGPPWNNTKVPKHRWSLAELMSLAAMGWLVVVAWERWGDLVLELLK